MLKNNKKVLVAMSGGVDSSVAAALLQKKGLEVSGVFLRLWKSSPGGYLQDKKNLEDARKVAKKLGIRLQILDVRKKFRNEVVKYFLDSYQKGETPNPCVFCNKNLKLKIILQEMKKVRANFIATGHYAQIKNQNNGGYSLLSAKDKDKDQSYFLYTLSQKELAKIVFPLGEIKKSEVKKIAKKLGLPVLGKKESQDICFIKNGEVSDFLKKNLKLKKGKIVNEKGSELGTHDGLELYTLGQRKGIGVGGHGPYFVFEKDRKNNKLRVINSKNRKTLKKDRFFVKNINWIASFPDKNQKILVCIRYRKKPVSAIIKKTKGKIEVFLKESQEAVTPGQSAVFYDHQEQVLGGGIISF